VRSPSTGLSVSGIGDIALVQELLRKLVCGSLVAVLELGGQAFAQGFELALNARSPPPLCHGLLETHLAESAETSSPPLYRMTDEELRAFVYGNEKPAKSKH
jgi:hypothetical protein